MIVQNVGFVILSKINDSESQSTVDCCVDCCLPSLINNHIEKMLDFAIFAVTFVLALVIAIVYLYPSSKKTTTIPGLEPTSQTDGNQSDIKNAGSLHEFLVDLHKRFGPIASFWIGRELIVSTASPELHKQQNMIFDRPPSLFKLFEVFIGPSSIQYANKADGRRRRKLYDRPFSADALRYAYPILQTVSNELVDKWAGLTSEEHIPLSQYMISLAVKAIVLSSFGKTLSDKAIFKMSKSYDICWSVMEASLTEGFPAQDSDEDKRFQKTLKELKESIQEVIADRKKNFGEGDTGEELFIDVLINSGFSEDVILSDTISYMVGGFHTTGNVLTWAIYFLASHSDIQERAAAEVKEQIGSDDIDHENVDSLVYLRQVIDETLRCAVIAPWAARTQDCDSELGGHLIPKDTPVIQAFGVLHQDETYWPDPNKFDPERFNSANSASRPTHVFQPFGFAGRRKCPGYRLAYCESLVVLGTILRRFHISLVEGQVVTPEHGLVTHPSEEIWIRIKERAK